MLTIVVFENVIKQLGKKPLFLVRKLNKWARDVEKLGIEVVRKIPGYHDESLQGKDPFACLNHTELYTKNQKKMGSE